MRGDRFLDLAQQGRNGLQFYLASLFLLWLLLLPLHFLKLQAPAHSHRFLTALSHYLFQIAPFAILLLGLWIALQWIHHRSFLTLVTPKKQICYKRIAQGFSLWLLLLAITASLQFLSNCSAFQLNFHPLQWGLFLPVVLVCTPLQAATEELLLRGYSLQGVGQLTRNRLLLISLSGLLFAIAHAGNLEVSAGSHPVWAFCYYFACGSFPALITLWDDTLELAIGWHMANNLFVATLIQPAVSTLQTPAILTTSLPFNFQTGLALFLIQAIAFSAIFLGKKMNFATDKTEYSEPA
jgi:membrane protease YdiL (CAAX protease family)